MRPMKNLMYGERIYEEDQSNEGIITDLGRSNINPHIVKVKVIEDRTENNLPKDSVVLCKFVGLQDMTGDEKFYIVHPDVMEAVLE